jgi:hypothetical protein
VAKKQKSKSPLRALQPETKGRIDEVKTLRTLRLNQHHHTPKVPSRGQFLQKTIYFNSFQKKSVTISVSKNPRHPRSKNLKPETKNGSK